MQTKDIKNGSVVVVFGRSEDLGVVETAVVGGRRLHGRRYGIGAGLVHAVFSSIEAAVVYARLFAGIPYLYPDGRPGEGFDSIHQRMFVGTLLRGGDILVSDVVQPPVGFGEGCNEVVR